MTKNYCITHAKASYKNYCDYYKKNMELARKYKTTIPRRPIFPEDISENLARLILLKQGLDTDISRDTDTGDLVGKRLKRIEVKTCTSSGPMSFGPNEPWDSLVIQQLDINTHIIKLYLIKLSNMSPLIRKIKISKVETFSQCCKSGRRPHITMDTFLKQIPKNKVKMVFSKKITEI
jgi:hypothetical protein